MFVLHLNLELNILVLLIIIILDLLKIFLILNNFCQSKFLTDFN